MVYKPKILIVGDAVANTGFARVIYGIFSHLKDEYDLFQLGTNYFGDPHDWPWKIYPAGIGKYTLGEDRIEDLVSRINPDLIFMLQDPWALIAYIDKLAAYRKIPIVAYASLNTHSVEPKIPDRLRSVSRLVVYTEFAKHALESAAFENNIEGLPPVEVIPHGVDTDMFYPILPIRAAAQAKARNLIFPDNPELTTDSFIVLNANRNQPRKRIDITMEGFKIFASNKPDKVLLHLHMGLKDIGWDLKYLEKKFGLEKRLIFSTSADRPPDVKDSLLNLIYNAATVGINTASSEGWGLVSFEQAAAGLPQIVPAHTSGAELWDDCAGLLPKSQVLINPHSNMDEYLIRPEDVACQLQRAYENPADLAKNGELCLNNARQHKYKWEVISQQWRNIFDMEFSRRAIKI